jgi:hypothetical protein
MLHAIIDGILISVESEDEKWGEGNGEANCIKFSCGSRTSRHLEGYNLHSFAASGSPRTEYV